MRRFIPLLLYVAGSAAAETPIVKVNQIGFLPESQKLAVAPQSAGIRFEVVPAAGGKAVLSGQLAAPTKWDASGETVRIADFSGLATPGQYRIKVEGLPLSDVFTVKPDNYRALSAASLKAFYFNRTAIALAPQYAGAWARPAGHPDD